MWHVICDHGARARAARRAAGRVGRGERRRSSGLARRGPAGPAGRRGGASRSTAAGCTSHRIRPAGVRVGGAGIHEPGPCRTRRACAAAAPAAAPCPGATRNIHRPAGCDRDRYGPKAPERGRAPMRAGTSITSNVSPVARSTEKGAFLHHPSTSDDSEEAADLPLVHRRMAAPPWDIVAHRHNGRLSVRLRELPASRVRRNVEQRDAIPTVAKASPRACRPLGNSLRSVTLRPVSRCDLRARFASCIERYERAASRAAHSRCDCPRGTDRADLLGDPRNRRRSGRGGNVWTTNRWAGGWRTGVTDAECRSNSSPTGWANPRAG